MVGGAGVVGGFVVVRGGVVVGVAGVVVLVGFVVAPLVWRFGLLEVEGLVGYLGGW